MQIRRLYIKNFQSIKELEIKLEENSCYHIIGDNNIGKSALLKAINAVVNNVSSRNVKNFIRDDEDSFYIELEDFDYNIVRLSRGEEDYYSWIINGKEGRLDSTVGKVPSEVETYFNFYMDEKTKEIVNIRPPRAKLLFVDTTLGENYHILQKALRIEEFLAAIKLGDSKKRETKKEIQILNDRIEDESEELKNIPDYVPLLKDIEVYEKAADEYYNQILMLKEVIELNESINRKEDYINENSLNYDRESIIDIVNNLKAINDVVELHKNICKKENSIERKVSIINEFSKAKSLYDSLKESLVNKSLLETVSTLTNKIDILTTTVKIKEEIVSTWESHSVSKLVDNLKSASIIVNEGKKVREKLSLLKHKQSQYDLAESDKKQFMIDNKFCPVVLSTKDRKCPFSEKSLEDLLNKN